MKQTSVFRVTAEICFWFAVLSVFTALRAWRLPMALFAAACLLLGLIIVRCSNPALRLLLAVLPVLCFLTGPFSLLMVFPLLAWVYFAVVTVRGHYAMPLYEYRNELRRRLGQDVDIDLFEEMLERVCVNSRMYLVPEPRYSGVRIGGMQKIKTHMGILLNV